jgi:chorismate dehydratase
MKTEKIRISCVSYLNSRPFEYGLKHHPVIEKIFLSMDIPSVCASKLQSGVSDIGLVPAAAIPFIRNARVISRYCIGADGPVKSVTLLSQVPLANIKAVMMDYQSRTSVALAKILAHEYWKISPQWIETKPGFESQIQGSTAAVVIGDRSLEIQNNYEFVYDLSSEWKKFTGLPFVFACWVTNMDPGEKFIEEFNQALKYGLTHIDDMIKTIDQNKFSENIISDYLKKYLSYTLDDRKKKSMELFAEYLKKFTPAQVTD